MKRPNPTTKKEHTGGKPAHVPDVKSRNMVRALVTAGLTQDRTAAVLGINKSTLIKHYKKELEGARDEALGRNTVALIQMANKGNAAAAIYLQKCLGGPGWNEKNFTEMSVEHRGMIVLPPDDPLSGGKELIKVHADKR